MTRLVICVEERIEMGVKVWDWETREMVSEEGRLERSK